MGRICVYAAVKRSREWLEEQRAGLSATNLVRQVYRDWAANLVDLLGGCADFTDRPIYSLPAEIDWSPQRGIALVGDSAHVMPPVGLGVNLAMQDAADLALAIAGAEDWQSAMEATETAIRDRARAHMREAIPGFLEWFAAPSPFAR